MAQNPANVEENVTRESSFSPDSPKDGLQSGSTPANATDSLTIGQVNSTPSSSDFQSSTVEAQENVSEVPAYVDSSDEDYDPEASIDSKTADAAKTPSADTHSVIENPHSNASAVSIDSTHSATSTNSAKLLKKDSDIDHQDSASDSEPQLETTRPSESDVGPSEEQEDEEDEDYDPEVTVPSSLNSANQKDEPVKETPQLDCSAADALKEAYEAVMQSDLVKLEAFAKLSPEEQMAAIQALLQTKNVALPTLNDQNSSAVPINPITGKARPDLTQPMTSDEQAAWNKFLEEEAENSNWETLDKFPPGLRLFIGNLFNNPRLKEELFRVLNQYGDVVQITIKLGYGFAQFKSAEQSQSCVEGEKDIPFQGRVLRFNTSYGHKNPHGQNAQMGQMRGRERFDEGGNDQKRFRGDNNDLQIFVTDGSDEAFGKAFRNSLRNAGLTYSVKSLSSDETSEEMVEAAYLGSVGACVVKGSAIDLQVFQETADGGVKFDEYLGVTPTNVCELVDKAKQQKPPKKSYQNSENYSQRPYQNDRQHGNWRPNSYNNYNGRGNYRNNNRNYHGNQYGPRGHDGPNNMNNNWQPRGNWRQGNQGPNNQYYNNSNNGGSYNNPSNNYSGYQGNNSGHGNNSNFNGGYQGNNQYQGSSWNNQMGAPPPQNFNTQPPAPQFQQPYNGVPGNAMPPAGYQNPPIGMPVPPSQNAGFAGYPPAPNPMGQPMYNPASSAPLQPPVPETGSALMDMLAKLGRK
ncbi:hypothetical protein PUMCH_004228 [Australozyma saopauloensis]|uniref:RRM domain-containing protein n=1 Tax=Australozyma saopauloensis TaxID=291208 RepID=A0AAX4HE95_9ASCO|nr:hypothetical protein PUMCH_004228 [[Candida] saopauloensis]